MYIWVWILYLQYIRRASDRIRRETQPSSISNELIYINNVLPVSIYNKYILKYIYKIYTVKQRL